MSRNALEHGMAVALWVMAGALITFAAGLTPLAVAAGALAAGLAGYLFTDFRDLRDGAVWAWQRSVHADLGDMARKLNWLPRVALNTSIHGAIFVGILTLFIPENAVESEQRNILLITLYVAGMYVSIAAGVLYLLANLNENLMLWEAGELFRRNALYVYANLVKLVVQWTAKSFVFLLRFTRNFFWFIHTQKRVLRATDIMLGVFTAFFLTGNALMMLVAMPLGLLIGIVHWEIVSVRMLGVVPNGERHG